MKPTMRLDVTQRLTMTPALQQAIRMLQLSTLDLRTEIRDALESNLMLESEEPEPLTADANDSDTTASSEADIPESLPIDADWSDIYANNSAAPPRAAAENPDWREYQQASFSGTPNLPAHLAWQANMHPFTPLQRQAASHLIDAINGNGLLEQWQELNDRLTREYDLSPSDIERVLDVIQAFDPPGVGGRDVAECLAIQLHQLDAGTQARELALTVVENGHLATLAEAGANALAGELGVSRDALEAARALLQTLQPHPGEVYSQTQAAYVTPEVFAMRDQGRWQVQLNPDIAPRLRINSHYLGLMDSACNRQDRQTLKSHLQEARAFLHSLNSRNETLLQVAQCVVEAQRGFLDYGDEAMQPLVLRDVSSQLGIHESTVSRATANKFMQTPRGIFELKYFFSSQVATTEGGSASATAIQAMIKRLIGGENPARPLSDNKLAEMLRQDAGIKVARRTVAKYREALHIASTSQRRHRASS